MSQTIYDSHNIFAKILRQEISAKKVCETEYTLAFHDAYPKAPIHILVIPKGPYVHMGDFLGRASFAEIEDFWKTLNDVVSCTPELSDGHRIIANTGSNGGQEVPHFHIHVCGGCVLGSMLPSRPS